MSFLKNIFSSSLFTPIAAEAEASDIPNRKEFNEQVPSKKDFDTQNPEDSPMETTKSRVAREENLKLKDQEQMTNVEESKQSVISGNEQKEEPKETPQEEEEQKPSEEAPQEVAETSQPQPEQGEQEQEQPEQEQEQEQPEEEEEEEEEELVDPLDTKIEECKEAPVCHEAKHHFDECTTRVTEKLEKGDNSEDCLEEFFHLYHCARDCADPQIFKQLV
ncbi:ubiquinol-cytochrome-c reductase complex subunit 8, hinge protein [Schizosaccharomyces osmophilus]|uniref:Ubiquinol-cytochrome-c reductase complex subunit 8, hinge protein n=1 Tax=Schizosaccharomyces osmophilus TaxID=2545709 RepID=A0AAE9WDH9_9SCHI|nr:ubiquinol-cytochrome-c reductase complex subunit 8, hinge protein [Schizosaccharomyces osmophilus]WBW74205.1 ubiquinol-cytochrome-c reductase complex subunit 8, hinge protein [Schizosaccharomyces osmophilus]